MRLIVDALVVRRVPAATIGRWDRDTWSGAETYTTPSDDAQIHRDRRLLAAHHEYGRGIVEGLASAVLKVLDERGIAAPEAIRRQVLDCVDMALLSNWVRRAVTATTAEDVTR